MEAKQARGTFYLDAPATDQMDDTRHYEVTPFQIFFDIRLRLVEAGDGAPPRGGSSANHIHLRSAPHAVGRKQRSGCDVVPRAPARFAMPGLLLAIHKGVAAVYDIVYRLNDVVYPNKR